MNSTDEHVLRQRLHAGLDRLAASQAPVGAVLRRGTAARTRRWVAAAAGLAAAGGVIALVVALPGTGRPAASRAAARPGQAGLGPATATPARPAAAPRPAGQVFAAGLAAGVRWRLAVRNMAGPGVGCLPAITLNGGDGDLLAAAPQISGAMTGLALLAPPRGRPGGGYAAVRVRAAVTSIAADLADGTRLTAAAATVRACGRSLRLAGFAYPASGVDRITAYSGTQQVAQASPPASAVSGAGGPAGSTPRPVPGVWQNMWSTGGRALSGRLASGRVGAVGWRISVLLGAGGECFTGSASGPGVAGGITPAGGPVATGGTVCVAIQAPPATAAVQRLRIAPDITGYTALVSPRASYLVARLSGGGTMRLSPVRVAGRSYAALATPAGRTVTSLTLYDGAGQALGTVVPRPAPVAR